MAAAVKGKKERSADERVLEAIFNPEDPLGGDVGVSHEPNTESWCEGGSVCSLARRRM